MEIAMPPTIYDVARAAGVSIATVSHVLNGTGRVSDAVRKRVLETIRALNDQPDLNAASLTRKKTHTFGLIVPDIANPYFAELARLVEDESHRHGDAVSSAAPTMRTSGSSAISPFFERSGSTASSSPREWAIRNGSGSPIRPLVLSIPEAVGIVGFDDTPLAALADPPLSSVAQPLRAMVRLAVSVLLSGSGQVSGSGQEGAAHRAGKEWRFPPELVVRASSARTRGSLRRT
ncbi:MAG: LacI family transcriptional regulator [Hydrogenibacillus schlegelii]|uniref:LacI family transcriptional regulator n=1 Tax=Hydrogenibacillus schlegelii TaxID=1484 RepID=A0A947D198_HYDSH|nr:LacI family transcriptional regulator [Hydrogenibacillus schlegelii]